MNKKFIIIVLFSGFSLFAASLAVSQDEYNDEYENAVSGEGQDEWVSPEGQTDWLWAEVLSVYNQNNQLKLKVMDEETMEDKEVLMYVDQETVFDNVDSLLDIKPADSLSVEYIITADRKNIARRITVEKATEEGLSLPESVLDSTQPTYP